jgi:hypothetical protein
MLKIRPDFQFSCMILPSLVKFISFFDNLKDGFPRPLPFYSLRIFTRLPPALPPLPPTPKIATV